MIRASLTSLIMNRRTIELKDIPTWSQQLAKIPKTTSQSRPQGSAPHFVVTPNASLNDKVSLFQGDITSLAVDAIQNAANSSLLGGGGVDGAIHRAAGRDLYNECKKLNGCDTGQSKITKGYKLPSKHIIHTVGPMNSDPNDLRSCYHTTLGHMDTSSLRSLALCCVATGVYGFPLVEAAHIAIGTVRQWLERTPADRVDRIVFCVFTDTDKTIYTNLLQSYFPAMNVQQGVTQAVVATATTTVVTATVPTSNTTEVIPPSTSSKDQAQSTTTTTTTATTATETNTTSDKTVATTNTSVSNLDSCTLCSSCECCECCECCSPCECCSCCSCSCDCPL
ncbi:hypothetical protein SAMD00019534_053460, partial [Acytostelium subglobosum LB1]|uniref:hypothetical protein n=1 Tax=Acytostelium subglobosum LB1 TaxID=1410327 RepID=UPI0006451BA5